MGDSSDEDLNSDDEIIDLRPLWRDPPFLDEYESDDPPRPEFYPDDGNPPRIIELIPTIPSTENNHDPLQNLMNEINDMSRRVTNARVARQRILELGRPMVYRIRPLEEDIVNASSSNQPVMWSSGTQSRFSEEPGSQSFEDDPVPYQFNQLRHMVAGTTSSPPPRWARGRQTFAVFSSPGASRLVDAATQDDEDALYIHAQENRTRFVLPAAIEERERESEIDDATRADRALFVSDLVLSSLTKREESPAGSAQQNTSSANKETENPSAENYIEDSKSDDDFNFSNDDSENPTTGTSAGPSSNTK